MNIPVKYQHGRGMDELVVTPSCYWRVARDLSGFKFIKHVTRIWWMPF